MRLTGKASSYFYSWLHQRFDYQLAYNAISSSKWFESLHPSMQWGIYQDWADSIGIDIYTFIADPSSHYFTIYEFENDSEPISGTFKTRQEARNAAIETLNKLINEQ